MFPDPHQYKEVVHAYTSAIATIWITMTPMLGVSFILVLFLRQYTLKRVTIKGGLSEKAGAGTTAVDEKLKVDDLEAGKGKNNDDEDDEDETEEIQEIARDSDQRDAT